MQKQNLTISEKQIHHGSIVIGRASNLDGTVCVPQCTRQNKGLRCNVWHWFCYSDCHGIKMVSCELQHYVWHICLAHLYRIIAIQLASMYERRERGKHTLNTHSSFLGRLHNWEGVRGAPLGGLWWSTIEQLNMWAAHSRVVLQSTHKTVCQWYQGETDNNGRHSPVFPIYGIYT